VIYVIRKKVNIMEYLPFATKRAGYSFDQCPETMTVRELIDYLEQLKDEEICLKTHHAFKIYPVWPNCGNLF